jgi:hypothetical protein
MSSLDRLRGRSPRKSPPRSPTSSPQVNPPDPTIRASIPYLRDILSTPGSHNTASFLREVFTEYLRLSYDISNSEDVPAEDRITLQRVRDMFALTKTIRGMPGHESARFHVVDYECESVNVWTIVVPIYRLSEESDGQRPTLNLANIKLVEKDKEERAFDALSSQQYEKMLQVLISHVMKILGSDSVPVVMKPVTTESLRKYIEPVTRLGKWDSMEFPAVEGEEKPRFRLLGLSDREVLRRGWIREGEFGWTHIKEQQDQEPEQTNINGTRDI